ncbi:hypothetical protein ACLOJK_018820 [Asimina triloba]
MPYADTMLCGVMVLLLPRSGSEQVDGGDGACCSRLAHVLVVGCLAAGSCEWSLMSAGYSRPLELLCASRSGWDERTVLIDSCCLGGGPWGCRLLASFGRCDWRRYLHRDLDGRCLDCWRDGASAAHRWILWGTKHLSVRSPWLVWIWPLEAAGRELSSSEDGGTLSVGWKDGRCWLSAGRTALAGAMGVWSVTDGESIMQLAGSGCVELDRTSWRLARGQRSLMVRLLPWAAAGRR